MGKKTRPQQVTEEQIAGMAELGVSAEATTDIAVAERSGSDDKVAAVTAEGAKPRIPTFTPEARLWLEEDPYGLKTEGLYGQRGQFAIRPNNGDKLGDLARRAQFIGRPLTVADMLEIHGPDASAPASVSCTSCGEDITQFVRTAMVTPEGDLVRNKETGAIVYRGQFVTTGRPLKRHAAHTGTCLFKLRDNLGKKKTLPNSRVVPDLLPSQSFDQAGERLAGLEAHFAKISAEKQSEKKAMAERLGATVGDVARQRGGRTDDGIDRGGAFTPRTPRGKRRQERWGDNDE